MKMNGKLVDTNVIIPNMIDLMNMWIDWRKEVETKMCEVEKSIYEDKKQKMNWRLIATQNLKVVVKGLEEKDRPRDQTCVSCIAGRFFTAVPPGKPNTPRKFNQINTD